MDEGGISGSTTVTLHDHFRASLAVMNLYVVVGVPLFAFAYAMLQGPRSGTTMPVMLMNAALLFLALAVAVALMAAAVTFMQAAITTARLGKTHSVVAYRFDDRGLTMSDRTGMTVTTPWNMVKRAREDSVAFRFRLSPAGARYIPKRAFATADMAAIRTLLAEKLGSAAKLKV